MTIDEFMNFMRRKEEKPKTPPPPPKSRRRRARRRPILASGKQDTAATTTVPTHVGDYLATSTTLDNIQRETGCKISQTNSEVTFAGSDFQIRAARVESCNQWCRGAPAFDFHASSSRASSGSCLPYNRRHKTTTIVRSPRWKSSRDKTAAGSRERSSTRSPSNRHSGLASGWWAAASGILARP